MNKAELEMPVCRHGYIKPELICVTDFKHNIVEIITCILSPVGQIYNIRVFRLYKPESRNLSIRQLRVDDGIVQKFLDSRLNFSSYGCLFPHDSPLKQRFETSS